MSNTQTVETTKITDSVVNYDAIPDKREATEVGKKMSESEYSHIVELYEACNKNMSESVWELGDGVTMVTFEDLREVLYEKTISTTLLDTFCSIMLERIGEPKKKKLKTLENSETINAVIFSSTCYDHLSKGRKYCITFFKDDKICDALRDRVNLYIFPLNTDGSGNTALHFTLLTLNAETGKRIFYNPMLFSGTIIGDLYERDARKMVGYVENFVKKMQVSSTQLTQFSFFSYRDTPQQAKNSDD